MAIQDTVSESSLWKSIWNAATSLISEFGLPQHVYRPFRKSRLLNETLSENPVTEVDYISIVFIPFVTRIVDEFKSRFSDQNCDVYKGIMALCPRDYYFLYSDPILKFGEHYGNIINIKDLRNDIRAVKRILESRQTHPADYDLLQTMTQLLSVISPLREALSEFYTLLKIAITFRSLQQSVRGASPY